MHELRAMQCMVRTHHPLQHNSGPGLSPKLSTRVCVCARACVCVHLRMLAAEATHMFTLSNRESRWSLQLARLTGRWLVHARLWASVQRQADRKGKRSFEAGQTLCRSKITARQCAVGEGCW